MPSEKAVLAALQRFAQSVTAKMSQLTKGDPEDQLRSPFESLMEEVGQALGLQVVCTGETRLVNRLGKPDYAVHATQLLAGYVELKAPGVGANPKRFTGHNKKQWKRFSAIPNLIYCDGNEWGLYRSGEAVRPIVYLSGDVSADGKKAVTAKNAQVVLGLLTDFLQWQPTIPTKAKGKIDLEAFATMLAPLCRMLRDDVREAVKDPKSPLVQLAKDWRQLLFPDVNDEQFADAYAQTVTFALLLARSEKANPLTLESAEKALAAGHSLLSRALQVLTDPKARPEVSASLDLLIRVISEVPLAALSRSKDPWLYFYEDFMAAYDPDFRKKLGVYYTPVEVVRAQVRLIDDLLKNMLGKPLGFADHDVVTLDPAAGTGTYLLGVIEHALDGIQAEQGKGAVPGQATAMAKNVYGFEIMVGPFAISELRISRALQDRGARLPEGGIHVYLTDTLESPNTPPPALPFYLKPIAEQHVKALEVKCKVPVIVCLGNPPYDRHEAVDATEDSLSKYGGWVRFGDPLEEGIAKGRGKRGKNKKGKVKVTRLSAQEKLRRREKQSILYQAFVEPTLTSGYGVHIKNLYNLYVYFWRWALWKVFEHTTSTGPGVVSYISASSYLDGDAFCGMREHMRRLCDEIWILDLGGEGRGTRRTENVFAIQTPVAIAIAARYGKAHVTKPAKVRLTKISGTRDEKLKALGALEDLGSIKWEDCAADWQAPFRPLGEGKYFNWPLLTDLLPWQQPGMMVGRRWPICYDAKNLTVRWGAFCKTSPTQRAVAFKESPTGRKIVDSIRQLPPAVSALKPLSSILADAPPPKAVRYGYRSFDRQYVLADSRLIDRPSPSLWTCHGESQIYLATLLSQPLSTGPAVTVSAAIPDRDFFRGSYGARLMPLYRDALGNEANILPGLLDALAVAYGRKVMPEDFLAYVYGVLAQPAFTNCYADQLATRELRVPLTKCWDLFNQLRDAGAKLIWLHTYGERFVPKGKHRRHVLKGKARCTKAVAGDAEAYPEKYEYDPVTKMLCVGDGEFAPIAPEVYEFEVSGLKVVQSWLGYRMRKPKGKKSSPLDDICLEKWSSDFTTEFLELLWVLEATVAEYPRQAKLISKVVKGPCFHGNELPDVPEWARKPPARDASLFD